MPKRDQLKGWMIGEVVLHDGHQVVIVGFPSRRTALVELMGDGTETVQLNDLRKNENKEKKTG